jgi:hypothetical protein
MKVFLFIGILLIAFTACQETYRQEQIDQIKLEYEKRLTESDEMLDVYKRKAQNLEHQLEEINTKQVENSSIVKVVNLYEKPYIKKLEDSEFAEVVSLFDTLTEFHTNNYSIRALTACNGPADPELEYCNCSHFIYITTGTYDLPQEYQIFKIGPFFLPEFVGWNDATASPKLSIQHDVKGEKIELTIKVFQDKIEI